jgi:hypothetical protein
LPLESVLDHLHLLAPLRGRSRQRRGPCPVHDSSGKGRTFSVHLDKNVFQYFDPNRWRWLSHKLRRGRRPIRTSRPWPHQVLVPPGPFHCRAGSSPEWDVELQGSSRLVGKASTLTSQLQGQRGHEIVADFHAHPPEKPSDALVHVCGRSAP